jgi:hypothetical protein
MPDLRVALSMIPSLLLHSGRVALQMCAETISSFKFGQVAAKFNLNFIAKMNLIVKLHLNMTLNLIVKLNLIAKANFTVKLN